MAIRVGLMAVENNPEKRETISRLYGLPATDDWDMFESAYIDKKILEIQRIEEETRANPNVTSGVFTGPNLDTFLPFKPNRVYVERSKTGATFRGTMLTSQQQFDLVFEGIEPEGYEIIYIDEDGNRLSEKPPAPTHEDIQNAGGTLPEEWEKEWNENFFRVPSPPNAHTLPDTTSKFAPDQPDYAKRSGNTSVEAKEQFEKVLQETEKRVTMTDLEIEAKLEKLLTLTLPEDSTTTDRTDRLAIKLRERFSPERFRKVIAILTRHGPEEGLRHLKEVDPEIAEQVEHYLQLRPQQKPQEDSTTR